MITLFQLNDFVLPVDRENWHGYRIQSKSEVVEFPNSSKKIWGNTEFTTGVKSIDLELFVIPTCGMSAPQYAAKLNSLIGKTIYLIGYLDISESGLNTCVDSNVDCKPSLLWMSTTGAIKEIAYKDDKGHKKFDVKLELSSVWNPIDLLRWVWSANPVDYLYRPIETLVRTNNYRVYPETLDNYDGLSMWILRKYSSTAMYNPSLWLHYNDFKRPVSIGYAMTWTSLMSHEFVYNGEDEIWSYAPQSVYAFKNITTGTITLTTEYTSGFSRFNKVDTIDLTTTNTNLIAAGLSTLQTTDEIYVGDVGQKPGVILRSGSVLSVRPSVIYSDNFPGQLRPSGGRVSVSTPSVSVQYAYMHLKRML